MAPSAEHIMKLRLAVGRFGEMDHAKWWNSKGMLANIGEIAVSRGFPKSHLFARARAVFAVAGQRCDEIFDAPDAFTIWKLPAAVEEQLEDAWQQWLEDSEPWCEFVGQLNEHLDQDLLATLTSMKLVDDRVIEHAQKLRRGDDLRSVHLPRVAELDEDVIGLLAAAFSRGEVGQLAIPFVQLEQVTV